MMAVAVEDGPALRFEPAEPLFQFGGRFALAVQPPSYDVGLDGRFLMIQPEGGDRGGERLAMVIVQNWTQELLERVPVN